MKRNNRRGSAMLVAVLALVVLTGMSGAILTMSLASNSQQNSATDDVRATYLAETGVSHALANLTAGNDTDTASGLAAQPKHLAAAGPTPAPTVSKPTSTRKVRALVLVSALASTLATPWIRKAWRRQAHPARSHTAPAPA